MKPTKRQHIVKSGRNDKPYNLIIEAAGISFTIF